MRMFRVFKFSFDVDLWDLMAPFHKYYNFYDFLETLQLIQVPERVPNSVLRLCCRCGGSPVHSVRFHRVLVVDGNSLLAVDGLAWTEVQRDERVLFAAGDENARVPVRLDDDGLSTAGLAPPPPSTPSGSSPSSRSAPAASAIAESSSAAKSASAPGRSPATSTTPPPAKASSASTWRET